MNCSSCGEPLLVDGHCYTRGCPVSAYNSMQPGATNPTALRPGPPAELLGPFIAELTAATKQQNMHVSDIYDELVSLNTNFRDIHAAICSIERSTGNG